MGLREKAMELAAELKRTPDFAEFRQARKAIDAIPAVKREFDAFNQNQNAVFSSKMPSSEAASRMEQLNRKFAELSKIPEIDRYLKASKSFNNLLANTLKDVSASIDAGLK